MERNARGSRDGRTAAGRHRPSSSSATASPDLTRARSSPISAPTSSRSKPRTRATTRATGARPSRTAPRRCSMCSITTSAGWRSTCATASRAAQLKAFILDHADVVIQNMRPGAIDKLGLGAQALRAEKPSLIYCDLGAYGRAGPLRERPGYDPLMQAHGGIMSVTGIDGRRAGARRRLDRRSGRRHVGRDGHSRGAQPPPCDRRGLPRLDLAVRDRDRLDGAAHRRLSVRRRDAPPARLGRRPRSCRIRRSRRRTATSWWRPATTICSARCATRSSARTSSKDERFATNSKRVENRRMLIPMLEEIFRAQADRRMAGAARRRRRSRRADRERRRRSSPRSRPRRSASCRRRRTST